MVWNTNKKEVKVRKDIENFLKETMTQEIDYDFVDSDFDGRNLYPDTVEFSENVLGAGCIQKRKKEIYDLDEYDYQY